MNDTHPIIKQELQRRFSLLTPEERIFHGLALMKAGWQCSRAAIQHKRPNLSGRELDVAVCRWIYASSCSKELLDSIK